MILLNFTMNSKKTEIKHFIIQIALTVQFAASWKKWKQ